MKMSFVPFAAAALALSLGACGHKADPAANGTAALAGVTMNDSGDATPDDAAADNAAGNAIAPAPGGQAFADSVARANGFEIAAAKLALARTSSPKIKAFAETMIADHGAADTTIRAAAAKAMPAIIIDPMLLGAQNDALADLGKLSGTAFDRAYIAGQVDAHAEALALVKSYASDGGVAPLKAAAAAIEPVVQHHLDMAHALDS